MEEKRDSAVSSSVSEDTSRQQGSKGHPQGGEKLQGGSNSSMKQGASYCSTNFQREDKDLTLPLDQSYQVLEDAVVVLRVASDLAQANISYILCAALAIVAVSAASARFVWKYKKLQLEHLELQQHLIQLQLQIQKGSSKTTQDLTTRSERVIGEESIKLTELDPNSISYGASHIPANDESSINHPAMEDLASQSSLNFSRSPLPLRDRIQSVHVEPSPLKQGRQAPNLLNEQEQAISRHRSTFQDQISKNQRVMAGSPVQGQAQGQTLTIDNEDEYLLLNRSSNIDDARRIEEEKAKKWARVPTFNQFDIKSQEDSTGLRRNLLSQFNEDPQKANPDLDKLMKEFPQIEEDLNASNRHSIQSPLTMIGAMHQAGQKGMPQQMFRDRGYSHQEVLRSAKVQPKIRDSLLHEQQKMGKLGTPYAHAQMQQQDSSFFYSYGQFKLPASSFPQTQQLLIQKGYPPHQGITSFNQQNPRHGCPQAIMTPSLPSQASKGSPNFAGLMRKHHLIQQQSSINRTGNGRLSEMDQEIESNYQSNIIRFDTSEHDGLPRIGGAMHSEEINDLNVFEVYQYQPLKSKNNSPITKGQNLSSLGESAEDTFLQRTQKFAQKKYQMSPQIHNQNSLARHGISASPQVCRGDTLRQSKLNADKCQSDVYPVANIKMHKSGLNEKILENELNFMKCSKNIYQLENGRYKNSFEVIGFLGRGGFGVCHKVKHKLDSNFYAVKKIRIHIAPTADLQYHKVYREIKALPNLTHKHVVRYFGCWAERVEEQEEIKIKDRVQKMKKKLELVHAKYKTKASTFKRQKELKDQAKKASMKIKSPTAEAQDSFVVDSEDEKSKPPQNEDLLLGTKSQSKKKTTNSNSERSKSSSSSSSEEGYEESDNEDDEVDKIDLSEEEEFESDEDEDEEPSSPNQSKKGKRKIQTKEDDDSDYEEELDAFDDEDILDDLDSSEEDEDEDGDNSIGIFDDEALLDFIKKDEEFQSIDLMIQMEYCAGKTLRDFLDAPDRVIDRHQNFIFFRQMLSAVRHIHQNGFIHRDLKPANIFVDKEQHAIKIGDFGLARKLRQQIEQMDRIETALNQNTSPKGLKAQKSITKLMKTLSTNSLLTQNVGTSTYLSPEQEQNKPYNEKVDIFALGLILFELISKFQTCHERMFTLVDLREKKFIPEKIKSEFKFECEIVLMMVSQNPSQRPSAEDLLKHPTFLQWEKEVNHVTQETPKLTFEGACSPLSPNIKTSSNNYSMMVIAEELTNRSQQSQSSNINHESFNTSFKFESLDANLTIRQRLIKLNSMCYPQDKSFQLELIHV